MTSSPDSTWMTIPELSRACETLRGQGQKGVLCHGVFDLLHPGHLRHLAAARREGDYLVVTVTADRHVNKGPGRPVYSEDDRCRMLAALSLVDFVAISDELDAVNVIGQLRPDVYVKGDEYEARERDVTGKISDEEAAVIAHGGRIHFTCEQTLSSSALINAFLVDDSSPRARWLAEFRANHTEAEVRSWITRLRDVRVLVIGEAIIDEYVMCEALGKSSKDPVLAFRVTSKERQLGGSAAIANHCAGLGAQVTSLFRAGAKASDHDFILQGLDPNVRPAMVVSSSEPTIVKRRYVDVPTQARVFETYEMRDDGGVEDDIQVVLDQLPACLQDVDLVLVADYGHGLMAEPVVRYLAESGVPLAVNTQSNAGNRGFNTISRYPRCDFVCLNGSEVLLELRRRHLRLADLVPQLLERTNSRRVMVTEGASGLIGCEAGSSPIEVPAFADKVTDRVGAGDALFATTSVLFAAGAPLDVTGLYGNLAGAASVAQLGTRNAVRGSDLARHAIALMK